MNDIPQYDYSKAPRHEEQVRRYVEEGVPVGDFLRNVFENNLVYAVSHADTWNRRYIVEWVTFVLNELPQNCWGSHEAYTEWVETGGLKGRAEQEVEG